MSRVRASRVSRIGRCSLSSVDLVHTILTVTDNGGGAALVTTAAAHGLSGGEDVVISGTSVAGYNTTWTGITAVNATQFLLTGLTYISDATGGSWRIG